MQFRCYEISNTITSLPNIHNQKGCQNPKPKTHISKKKNHSNINIAHSKDV